jgi:alpha-amylase
VEEVQPEFFPDFNNASGVYCVGEVDDGDPTFTCPYQNYLDGVLDYPMYYPLLSAFESSSGSISALYNMINEVKSDCVDSNLLGTFVENHDNPRFASYTEDYSLAKNAIAFTILSDGIPIIYAGEEQHYDGGAVPNNREATWLSGYNTSAELYQWISTLNQIRNYTIQNDDGFTTFQASCFFSLLYIVPMNF